MPWTAEKRRAFERERYRSNVEFVRAYKLEKGCADCGYKDHHAGLEFDHVKPHVRGTVSRQIGKSRQCIVDEIAQCEVVCGTCHGVRTWKRNNESFNQYPAAIG